MKPCIYKCQWCTFGIFLWCQIQNVQEQTRCRNHHQYICHSLLHIITIPNELLYVTVI